MRRMFDLDQLAAGKGEEKKKKNSLSILLNSLHAILKEDATSWLLTRKEAIVFAD